MSKYYYHGIKPYVEHIESIKWLIKIIESDGIKSRRLTNQIPLYTGFNGADYISVCSKEEFNEYMKYPNNCFFKYIHSNYCFIISDEINAIKTNYFDLDNRFLDSFTISSGETELVPDLLILRPLPSTIKPADSNSLYGL